MLDNRHRGARPRETIRYCVGSTSPSSSPPTTNPHRKDARLWKLTLHSLVCVVLCCVETVIVLSDVDGSLNQPRRYGFCFSLTCYRLIPHIFNAVIRKHSMHTTGKQFMFVFSSFCFICAFSSAVGIVYFTENVFLDLETNFCYDIGLLM